jgi:hypothetical protein
MRLEKYITERYYDRLEIRRNSFDVFVNPTKIEMNKMNSLYLRFIADPKKKEVYIWTYDKGMHTEVYRKIKKKDLELETMLTQFYGLIKNTGNKWKFMETDQDYDYDDEEDIIKSYKWLNTYFKFTEVY